MPVTGSSGQILDGRYRLVALLGRGGMGSVWRADHLTLRTPVAIKLLHPEVVARPDMLARFAREAQATARLRSVHVVQILDHGVSDGVPYIAMECLEGESLAQRLDREPRLGPAATAQITTGVCRALARAHSVGIVHRDLKPDNIFIARDEGASVVKVLDFGIAKMIDPQVLDPSAPTETSQRTNTGAILGTPRYMSPEQVRGQATVDARSDLWSLAVIAFECLTGRVPFAAGAMGELVLQICSEPVPRPSAFAAVPEGFDAWFERATERPPAARFQTVRDFADALADVLAPGERWLPAADESGPVVMAGAASASDDDDPDRTVTARPKGDLAVTVKERARVPASPAKPPAAPSGSERSSELILVDRVREFWIRGVLEHSLQDELRVELGKDERLSAVDRGFELAVARLDEDDQSLAAGVSVADYFDAHQRALLVLGEPGAGKTITLLELARALCVRAEASAEAPLPVVLSLSAWHDAKRPIAEWVAEQLRDGYRIPKKLGRPWVEGDRLALLFDGLDEVAPALQDDCVRALNRFRDDHGLAWIVVTCRREDYAARAERLKLSGALQLRALDDAQIDGYLAAGGERLTSLRAALEADPGLREVSRSPLMLGIMSLAYVDGGATAPEAAGSSAEERRLALFDRYVDRMLRRREGRVAASRAETIRWLTWLARDMAARGETVFQLENLQPASLPAVPRLLYFVATRIFVCALVVDAFSDFVPDFLVMGGLFGGPWGVLDHVMTVGAVVRSRRWRLVVEHAGNAVLLLLLLCFVKGSAAGAGALLAYAFDLLTVILWAVPVARRRHALAAGREVTTTESLDFRWRRWAVLTLLTVIAGATLWKWTRGPQNVPLLEIVAALVLVGMGLLGSVALSLHAAPARLKTRPNQGILLTLRWSPVFALASALPLSVLALVTSSYDLGIASRFLAHAWGGWYDLSWGLRRVILPASFVFWLLFGGLDLLFHYALRAALALRGDLPLRAPRFLDGAAQQILLRKVGGGYIFVHRLLLEYFARHVGSRLDGGEHDGRRAIRGSGWRRRT